MTKPTDIQTLIEALRSGDEVEREAAVARLRVIGSRAVARLTALVGADADRAVRAAALRALEGGDDRRTLGAAVGALGDADPGVVAAAIGVLRGWLPREPGTRALDALSAVALDDRRDPLIQRAALDALADLPHDLVQPILDREVRQPASSAPLLDGPAAVADWASGPAAHAPLSALHEAVVRSREREGLESSARARAEWLAARGAAHATLARRGSRVALYDLRETLAAATEPLPLDFLAAVAAIGDASCLEPMARAWAAAADSWWRERLASAAGAIVDRTRLSRRRTVVTRIRAKWPGFL